MALPPRPKDRALVRRAVVASVLAAGCDQGATPSVPPQTQPFREEKQQLVPPQVAWDATPEPTRLDDTTLGSKTMPPQVAHSTYPPKHDPANGFTLLVVDDAQKPLAKKAVKVTLEDGTVLTATTSDRGTALIRTRMSGALTVSVSVRGYEPASDVAIDRSRRAIEKVVMKKQGTR